jgi:hypothetical protein
MPDTENPYTSPGQESSANPYESPQAEISSVKPLTNQGILTESMLLHLKKTAPWMSFIGILGFIGCGLLLVFMVIMSVGINSAIPASIPGAAALGQAFTATMIALQIISLPLMFFPSFFLFSTGKKIRNYVHSGNDADLETAFKFNKFFWTFSGVLTIIYASIMALILLFSIIGAIAALAFI